MTDTTTVRWCATCDLPEHLWDQQDSLHIDGSHQCPGCRRADIDDDHAQARREDR